MPPARRGSLVATRPPHVLGPITERTHAPRGGKARRGVETLTFLVVRADPHVQHAAGQVRDGCQEARGVSGAPEVRVHDQLVHLGGDHAPLLIGRRIDRLRPGLVVAKGASDMEVSPLSRDPQVQRDFDADPLTYKGGVPILTGATMIIQGDEVIARAARRLVDEPALTSGIRGLRDELSSLGGTKRIVREVETLVS